MAALAAAAENQGVKPKSKIVPSPARLKPCPVTGPAGSCAQPGLVTQPPGVQRKIWDTPPGERVSRLVGTGEGVAPAICRARPCSLPLTLLCRSSVQQRGCCNQNFSPILPWRSTIRILDRSSTRKAHGSQSKGHSRFARNPPLPTLRITPAAICLPAVHHNNSLSMRSGRSQV
jgi:hypothetical protein